ncbi:MAG: acetyl-CoA carboxylase biotin carboxyl carrier protein [Clostridium perfringens]|nr:acetyl-CoA carboxylase biotin carboxyl carrier protein [Clostridium perfringens]
MLNYSEVKELINIIDKSSLRCFELESQDIKLKMNKNSEVPQNHKEEPIVKNTESHSFANELLKSHGDNEVKSETKVEEVEIKEENIEDKNLKVIKSPLVGTYYCSSSPGEDPYVTVGDKVKKGDVLCIVEAMKIMNEITSEYDGEIVEVMCKDDDIVEFGLPLFKIK